MKKFLAIVSFLFLTFYAEKTYACTCRDINPNNDLERKVEGHYKDAFAVFSAKVLSIEKTERRDLKVRLRVNKFWKRNLGKSITITTSSVGSMCGYTFVKGKNYLIYAYGPNRKDMSTSICTRTTEISLTEDVPVLDALKKKT